MNEKCYTVPHQLKKSNLRRNADLWTAAWADGYKTEMTRFLWEIKKMLQRQKKCYRDNKLLFLGLCRWFVSLLLRLLLLLGLLLVNRGWLDKWDLFAVFWNNEARSQHEKKKK